jgi:hypothetical protein
LGALTKNMEIDAILIASKELKKQEFFVSDGTCDPESRQCVDNDSNSLYCMLCKVDLF